MFRREHKFKMKNISQSAFTKAALEIENRKSKALQTLELHKIEISQKAPEINSLYNKVLQTSIELSKAIISHSGDIDAIINELKEKNLESQFKIKIMLKEFGYPEDYLKAKYTCSICNDSGYVNGNRCVCFNELIKKFTVDELNESCKIELHDFEEFNLNLYSNLPDEKSGIVPRERMNNILIHCKDFVDTFSKHSSSLFFLGKTGLGKTFISSMIAKSLIDKGFNVAFDSINNFLIKAENDHFGRSSGNTVDTLLNADLVILDDLGSEFSTPFNNATLYNIINSRINMDLPTIVSTNLSLSELEEKYDDRIISRLTGMYTPLRFFGTDIRQVKRRMMNK